jgi:hypothetical protein
MVDFHDRRDSVGSGDFNNPKGTFSIASPDEKTSWRWRGMSVDEVKPEVVSHFRGQKDTQTWQEANRLAKRRTDYTVRSTRKSGVPEENIRGDHYAGFYETHLNDVMSQKGPALAEQFGELHHRQSGYGRT